ncbi:MAG: hypothetical protein A2170_00485 [Deltaproteobacteria bacterium RBG_13_53_10]|nr:MAG: hypothetical protein A2170_00485 [Deltaproteobacteria bacterium RBG_13_53_10]
MPRWRRRLTYDDERLQRMLGLLLRTGVIAAATIVFIGGIIYLIRHGAGMPHYHIFLGEPEDFRRLPGIVESARSLHGRGIIQVGFLILIATPVARVVFSVFAFAVQRDRTYVIITLIVLAVLAYSLMGGGL